VKHSVVSRLGDKAHAESIGEAWLECFCLFWSTDCCRKRDEHENMVCAYLDVIEAETDGGAFAEPRR
jgi:hypothetical protein